MRYLWMRATFKPSHKCERCGDGETAWFGGFRPMNVCEVCHTELDAVERMLVFDRVMMKGDPT